MTAIYRVLLIAVLAMLGTQASAQSRYLARYEMVAIPQYQNGDMRKVVILDRRTGELWALSESSVILPVGRIFPIGGAGSIARIIHVNPEENGR
jgi:hypothetical protein